METSEGNDGIRNPLTLANETAALEATQKTLEAKGVKGIKRKTPITLPPPEHFDNSPTRPPKRDSLKKLTRDKIHRLQFKK